MSAESIRAFVQRAPWWLQPIIGLIIAALVIALLPLIILAAVGYCVWFATFGTPTISDNEDEQ